MQVMVLVLIKSQPFALIPIAFLLLQCRGRLHALHMGTFLEYWLRRSMRWCIPGTLICLPNEHSWKSFNAFEIIGECSDRIWHEIEHGRFLTNPELISQFVLVVYPDVKRHQFHYWFGMPAINPKLSIIRIRSGLIKVSPPLI
jgi:hypothetical protein